MPKSVKSAAFLDLESHYGHRRLRSKIILYMAYRNLVIHKLRTILTAGGVLIGIGSITFLLSLGFGLQDLVSRQVIGSKSVTAIDVTPPAQTAAVRLTSENLAKMRALPHVTDLARSYALAGKVTLGTSATNAVVYGADSAYLSLSALKLVTNGGRDITNDQILINTSLLKLIGLTDPAKATGRRLRLDLTAPNPDGTKRTIKTDATVRGVVDTGTGSEVYLPEAFLTAAGLTDYAQVKVVADDQANVPAIRRQIESLGFNTSSPLDTIAQINQVFVFFNFILAGFGGIGMIIAILGMFNTLTISLLERTREIALMISLGARRRDIGRLFIAEAIGLAALGGVSGIGAAWLLGRAIDILLTQIAHTRGLTDTVHIFALPLWLVAGILGLVIAVALLVVAYPAMRAVRISPIEALRHD